MSPSLRRNHSWLPSSQTLIQSLLGILFLAASGWVGYVWNRVGDVDARLRAVESAMAAEQAAGKVRVEQIEGLKAWVKNQGERIRELERHR